MQNNDAISRRNQKPFVSIGFKLIAMISFIIVGSLGGMTFLATRFFSADVETSVKFNTLERAEMISSKLEEDFASIIEKGRFIASALEGGIVAGGSGERLQSVLFREGEGILSVAPADQKNGAIIVRGISSDEKTLKRFMDGPFDAKVLVKENEAAFMRSFRMETVILNVSDKFTSPVIALSFPYIVTRPDVADRIIILFIAADRFLNVLKSNQMYVDFVVDGQGDLLVHPDASLLSAKSNVSTLAIVRDMLTSPARLKQLRYEDESGETYLGSYKKLAIGGLGTVSTVKESLAMESVFTIQRRNILITVIIVAIAILATFLFSKTLTLPVKRLVAGTGQIRDGDFDVKIKPAAHDEIGNLTEAFAEMAKGLAERAKIKDAFGKFVNKEIAERVLRDEIKLGGERKVATIMFSDIRSFTAISENLSPEEVVEFLNDYMTRMVSCVNETHGVVDKFIGDAVMAVWGAPVSHGNDTENAVNGTLMMRKALMEFNVGRGGPKKPIIRIGCGVNTGPVLAGQIGSHERMEYTVIGDAVNLASRIEALNKPFGTDILVSENAYAVVKDIFRTEPMKAIKVKGKSEPQQIYAVIGRMDDPDSPKSLAEVRSLLGIEYRDISDIDPDEHEEKYEIINKE